MKLIIKFYLVAFRNENVYTIDLDNITSKESICLAAINENSWL